MNDFQPLSESPLGVALKRFKDLLENKAIPALIERMENQKWVLENMINYYVSQQEEKDTDG